MNNMKTLTVSQLNMYVRLLLESDGNLRRVSVKGEISNFVHHRSGHLYMTLKDGGAAVKAVMFRTAASGLSFEPSDGMTVTATGGVSLFERDGSYQFYIDSMLPAGEGEEYLRFVRLRKKLESMGIFDPSHKKSLPQFPRVIGLITSPTGAAVRDVLAVLGRRYPQGEILFMPCRVQGENAASTVIRGIEYFNSRNNADVIIITRGGGSSEDLSVFNDEALALAAYNSTIPIISAVGHEIDYTILDYAADVRCPTPSAAAETVSPDSTALLDELEYYKKRITGLVSNRLMSERMRLERAASTCDITAANRTRLTKLEALRTGIIASETALIENHRRILAGLSGKLSALSPLNTLARGFASVTAECEKPVTSVSDVNVGDSLRLRLKDGDIYCHAEEIGISGDASH